MKTRKFRKIVLLLQDELRTLEVQLIDEGKVDRSPEVLSKGSGNLQEQLELSRAFPQNSQPNQEFHHHPLEAWQCVGQYRVVTTYLPQRLVSLDL